MGEQPGAGYSWAEPGPQSGYPQDGYSAAGAAWPDDQAGSAWAPDDGGADDAWFTDSLAGRIPAAQQLPGNALRGFPPTPGEPLPVYPPGPFAAWNRDAADRGQADADGRGRRMRPAAYGDAARAATITPDEFDTDYSLPAIKDPILGTSSRSATGSGGGRGSGPGARPGGGGERRGPARATGPAGHGRGPAGHGPAGRGPAGRTAGTGRARPRSRGRHLQAWLAIGAAATLIAVVAAVLVLTSQGNTPAAAPKVTAKPQSTTSSPKPPPGPWEYIGARTTDTQPLTSSELYPQGFADSGTYYWRMATSSGTSCEAAVIGGALQAAVHQAGCSQAVRATYLARTAKMMATIGVFNLTSVAAATKAALKAGRSEFVAQLTTSSGLTHRIGQGTGIEEALVKGHYLVLAWAEYTDLRAPRTAAQRDRLEAFMNLLISKTVNASLSYRMVYGQPTPSALPAPLPTN